jgi:hypothetical protein
MHFVNPIPQVSYALQKSLGLWFTFWAIRASAGVDYKLSAQGRAVRWAVVFIGFALTSIAGARLGWFRVIAFLVALSFLCWPNLAYYLNSMFEAWPSTEAQVDSIQQQSASRWQVAYDFELDGERYGGRGSVKVDPRSSADDPSLETMRIGVCYDPLNPGRSSRIQQRKFISEPPITSGS